MNSCIYNGEVTHTRFKPVRHFLKYKTFSLLIDLDEINQLDRSINIFSHNKFNIFSFYDKDHGERDGSDLKEWVLKNISKLNIKGEINKVKILCYPRIFGYVFNPLSIFYCLSLIHISEPTRPLYISYAVFCLKKKILRIAIYGYGNLL